MHFVDLVLLIQGGEEGVLNDVVEVHAPLSLCHPPCCFFGICLRHLTFTKYAHYIVQLQLSWMNINRIFYHFDRIRLRIVKGLVYQAPVFQFVLIVIMNVLDHAEFLEKNVNFSFLNFEWCSGPWVYFIIAIEIGQIVSIFRRFEHFGIHVRHLGFQHFERGLESAVENKVEEIHR